MGWRIAFLRDLKFKRLVHDPRPIALGQRKHRNQNALMTKWKLRRKIFGMNRRTSQAHGMSVVAAKRQIGAASEQFLQFLITTTKMGQQQAQWSVP